MSQHRSFTLLAVLALSVCTSGCFYSREVSRLKKDIERSHPGIAFDQGVSMRFGPAMLRSVGWLAGRVPEAEAQAASAYLREVQHVKVGYYPVDDLPPLDEVDLAALSRLEREGWEVAVKVYEEDALVWILYRERFDTVRDIYALVLSDEELVVASLRGHLDRLLQMAIDDYAQFEDIVFWNPEP